MPDKNLNIVIRAFDEATRTFSRVDSAMQNTADNAAASSNKMSSAFAGVSKAWIQFGVIVASSAWFIAGAKKALEAEVAFNKLGIQIDALGMSYKANEAAINDAINATSRYAIVQNEDVATVLQQLVFHTGNLTASMENLNLVYDLAYMKGIDVADASTIVGKAMAGNIEGLGRLFPELKNVDELLGKHATTAEKAAYAQAFFREKVADASDKMTEHDRAVRRVLAAYEDLHQFVGGALIGMADELIKTLKGPVDLFNFLADGIDRVTESLNPYAVATKKNVEGLMDYEKAQRLVGSAHERTAAQIAAASKIESDAVDAQLARIKEMTVPKGGGSLQAFILGDLDMAAMEAAGLELGSKFLNSFNAARATEVVTDDLSFQMKYITRLQWDQEYWDAYWVIQDEAFNKESELEQMLFDRNIANREQQLQAEQNIQQQIMNMKFAAANQSIALLSFLGQKNKAAALAALVLQKGLAMAQVWIQTNVAAAGARAALSMIPVVGPALAEAEAARIMMWGKIQMGLIAATGIAEAAVGGGGGGPSGVGGGGGVGALPISAPMLREEDARKTQTINITIHTLTGAIDGKAQEEIIRAINEAGDRDVKINSNVIAVGA